ncbi:O-antigen ligase family protein [Calothrix sp. 336/3]|uniref:O-antigen ligase family protein n=1 Tax=Calothrix sp. 336/3 TaxID=1337936 RepID=UPI000624B76B|nr:O-antigen ligase family protein [Calothrix sp. 336/3]AKG24652.1 polymerase [Calothrix sp. 336/3]
MFSRHPEPKLQFAWNSAQLGLILLPFVPALGAVILVISLFATWQQQYRRIIRYPLNQGFGLLSLLLIITTCFAWNKSEALLGLCNFLPFFLFFAAFSVLVQTPAQLKRISEILVVSSLPIVLIGMGQLFLGFTTSEIWQSLFGWAIAPGGNPVGRMASVFMYANILAGYLVIVFILALGLWLAQWKQYHRHLPLSPRFLFLSVTVILDFVGLILTNSRNAWAIAILACFAYAVYQGWRLIVLGVSTITTTILLAAFAPNPIASSLRQFVPAFFWARLNDQMYPDRPVALLRQTQWNFALSMCKERPIVGWGLRNFTEIYQAKMNIWLGHPHNLYLMLAAETGIFATLLFCALLIWIVVDGVKVLFQEQYLQTEDKLLFFSYLLVTTAWILFNTVDVTIFDIRLNTISWLLIGAMVGAGIGKRGKVYF